MPGNTALRFSWHLPCLHYDDDGPAPVLPVCVLINFKGYISSIPAPIRQFSPSLISDHSQFQLSSFLEPGRFLLYRCQCVPKYCSVSSHNHTNSLPKSSQLLLKSQSVFSQKLASSTHKQLKLYVKTYSSNQEHFCSWSNPVPS